MWEAFLGVLGSIAAAILGKDRQKVYKIRNNLIARNPRFSGRVKKLEELGDLLNECYTVTLVGTGGAGKSSLALEYAHRNIKKYKDAVWWMDAETDKSLEKSAIEFVRGVMPELFPTLDTEMKPEDARKYMLDWFDKHHSYLIIYDNAEDKQVLSKYLPRNIKKKGYALITTRNDHLDIGTKLPLDVFSKEEAAKFLADRLELRITPEIRTLATQLGCLPLALEQAASYIKERQKTVKEYLALLDKTGLRPLEKYQPSDYKYVITSTWSVSIDKIAVRQAKDLLYWCSYMVPEKIPLKLFNKKIDASQELDDAVDELTRYSLVSMETIEEKKYLSMHRLTQQVIRESLKDDTTYIEATVELLLDALPRSKDYGKVKSRPWFREIALHAETVAVFGTAIFENDDEKMKRVALLYHWIARGYKELADYTNALRLYKDVIAIYEKINVTENSETANTYNSIALVYNNQGKYDDALKYHMKALPIRKEVLGNEHPDTAATYNNIALVYNNQGKYDEALEWYMKALVIDEKVLGTEHPDTAATYNNIALVYDNQGKYDKALEWHMKALPIREKVLGTEHPDTATTYNNIAVIYKDLGRYNEALPLYQKALGIWEKVLGETHPDTIKVYNNMSIVYSLMGNPTESQKWATKAAQAEAARAKSPA